MIHPIRSKICRYVLISIIFLVAFSSISLAYIKRDAELDRKQFQTHAIIIANDTWALNRAGAKAYLELAIKANNYQYLNISIPGEEEFLRVASPPLNGISSALYNFGLIGQKDLVEDILHEQQTIGTLHGRQYVRVIFPLLNILVFLLLLLLASTFTIYLFFNSKFLAEQIQERTKSLQESERRFHDLVNLLPEMVLETDINGTLQYCNKLAKERLKLPEATEDPAPLLQCIADEDQNKARQYFQATLTNQSPGLQEFTAIDPRNRAFPILIRSTPIINDDKIIGARFVIIDITERRRLEEQLLRDQKMKVIGLMAGGVAHDLNNILSGIISYPELLLLDMDKDNRMRRPLESIRKAGLDAAEVVADLLTVARGVAATKESVNINTLITDYLASHDFHQLRIRFPLVDINKSLADDILNICCSPIHIRKCLMNLITNGMEAIQGKGTLSITTRNHTQISHKRGNISELKNSSTKRNPLPPADKSLLPEGRYITIVIADSGSGISPHELEHIFEPFYTKKVMGRSGTGLGLAVVWNTMKDHGGVINVVSDCQGTTFEIYIPAVDKPETAFIAKPELLIFKGAGESVLVVDDEPQQRAIAQEILTSLNYQVVVKPSGEEAVQYLGTHSADLLVLDMIMSPGQNGRVTYEKILQIHPQQKALVVSGFAEDDDVRATLAMGAGGFISKPYTIETIGSAIKNILTQSPS
ncbi:MAG: response regulator [Desulforhopalus sp.]|nr:response regulator [Desulforhopalus sp.]